MCIRDSAIDEFGSAEYTWNISYFVYHPPEIIPPDEQSTVSVIVNILTDNVMTVLIGLLSMLVIVLLTIRLRQNKSDNPPANPPPAQSFAPLPANRYQQEAPKYADVKGAPDLSKFDSKWK